ncbi:MAG: hypothetical protein HN657_06765 [Candidatus Marinimicrobia bacterium]|jgi:hypothetical protein|nr:hypothetical protein [Candidatus Neomarinimicrobiota bacterium]MBT3496201.1 hypothetical protein [Candidatus Neomarinimicrobiota bacterium]MBT3691695.1 hypothetical protein [Candidatus Neomarinimicrobiota bacterium]MBT3732208.1 hypothetical protein [Candidatus Neomarinimicrobiota bacterium]MBT4143759.1 hypothetical protein [Candidatus Neomarinimicrobiota bacterium]
MFISHNSQLDFIYSSEKEYASLLPLFQHCQSIDMSTRMVKIHRRNIFKRYIRELAPHVVVAYDRVIPQIKNAGWKGKTIYVDHGLSPVKYYAYRYDTFHSIDLLFYPGPVFMDIMKALNPDFKNGLLGGLPKMDNFVTKQIDRESTCQSLGLDSRKPIILFAPTWGGKYSNTWGIKNAKYLDGYPNLIISPHPADYRLAKKFDAVVPNKPGETTKFIKLADLIISDVSSIIGEASILGKPVIQIELPTYPGCFPNPDKRKTGTWLNPEKLKFFIDASDPINRPFKCAFLDKDWIMGHTCKPADLEKTINLALSDIKKYKSEQNYWNEQNCYKADGKTNKRLAKMIVHFIETNQLKQL